MSNPHEAAARARKALALVAAIDAAFDRLGEVPSARVVGTFTPLMWDGFARTADVRPPSPETIAFVVRHFGERERDPLEADPFARCGGGA